MDGEDNHARPRVGAWTGAVGGLAGLVGVVVLTDDGLENVVLGLMGAAIYGALDVVRDVMMVLDVVDVLLVYVIYNTTIFTI